MKDSLLAILRCPACLESLYVSWREPDKANSIHEGLLRCVCGEWFPVIESIPRMLLSPHREAVLADHSDFARRHAEKLPEWRVPSFEGHEKVQRATALSFGAEWSHFRDVRSDYAWLFDRYFEGVDLARYRGLWVLDAGCGMGRWAAYWALAGACVVAVDLGPAVEVAAETLQGHSNAHLVQADLLRLPFAEATFPVVYSMGVLHHLADPEAGFRSVASRVAPGGLLGAYLYYSLENRPWFHRLLLKGVTLVRRGTVRLPHSALRVLSAALAGALAALFVWPARLLDRLGLARAARNLPLSQYAPLEWRILYNDTVDRFGAPLEARFSREQVRALYRRAGFREPVIPESFPYWHAWGSPEEGRAADRI